MMNFNVARARRSGRLVINRNFENERIDSDVLAPSFLS